MSGGAVWLCDRHLHRHRARVHQHAGRASRAPAHADSLSSAQLHILPRSVRCSPSTLSARGFTDCDRGLWSPRAVPQVTDAEWRVDYSIASSALQVRACLPLPFPHLLTHVRWLAATADALCRIVCCRLAERGRRLRPPAIAPQPAEIGKHRPQHSSGDDRRSVQAALRRAPHRTPGHGDPADLSAHSHDRLVCPVILRQAVVLYAPSALCSSVRC